MTSRVTVDAHAGWPIEVKTQQAGSPIEVVHIVPAKTDREFYIHDGLRITSIRELDRPSESIQGMPPGATTISEEQIASVASVV